MDYINYGVVIGCAVVAMIVGMIWYGPIFGKCWMKINGVDPNDEVAKNKMKEGMWITMGIQMAATLFMVWVLYIYLVEAADEMSMMSNALWIWAGFVVPTLASTVLWTTEPAKYKRWRFLIQAGYNFILFVVFAYMIQMFG